MLHNTVADRVKEIFSEKIPMLHNYFLPTSGTYIFSESALPFITKSGYCLVIRLLFGLCSLSCFVFHFTASVLGFVTPRGLSIFKPAGVNVSKDERFKVGLWDFALVMVFVATAQLDHRVAECLFAGHEIEMGSFSFITLIVSGGLFLVFPTYRHGT